MMGISGRRRAMKRSDPFTIDADLDQKKESRLGPKGVRLRIVSRTTANILYYPIVFFTPFYISTKLIVYFRSQLPAHSFNNQ